MLHSTAPALLPLQEIMRTVSIASNERLPTEQESNSVVLRRSLHGGSAGCDRSPAKDEEAQPNRSTHTRDDHVAGYLEHRIADVKDSCIDSSSRDIVLPLQVILFFKDL